MIGIIIALQRSADAPAGNRALIRIAGITMLERVVRQMRKQEISDITVLAPVDAPQELHTEAQRLSRKLKLNISVPADPAASLSGRECALVQDASVIVDDRLPGEMARRNDSSLLALYQRESVEATFADRTTTVDEARVFGGIALLAADRWPALLAARDIPQLSAVLKDMCEAGVPVLNFQDLPTYDYDMRREQGFFWYPVDSPNNNADAKRRLLDHAQKSVLDWPAWYIHRPIEKWIVFHLSETPITPNQLTLINNLLAFPAVYFFATGQHLAAFALALMVGVVDGLDGKTARIKVMTSQFGRIEEVLDKIYENLWYGAMAWFIAGQAGPSHAWIPWVLFGIILTLTMVDIVLGLIFKQAKGAQLDDFGEFERKFRVIGGRRNTYIWTVIPFYAAGLYFAGYVFIAAYAIITFAIHTWRFGVNISQADAQRQ